MPLPNWLNKVRKKSVQMICSFNLLFNPGLQQQFGLFVITGTYLNIPQATLLHMFMIAVIPEKAFVLTNHIPRLRAH